MIIVSDTSPINYLLLIGEINLLRELFQRVIIPEAVFAELNHPLAPAPVRTWLSENPSWVEIHAVPDPETISSLGAGEQQAITLAHRLGADLLLIDERKGRSEAMARGLMAAGTLNVLETAAQRGLIELTPTLTRLMQTNFRVSPVLIKAMLARDAESDKE